MMESDRTDTCISKSFIYFCRGWIWYAKTEQMKDRFASCFCKGEEWAFRKVYETFFCPLCMYAFRYVKNENAATDIVQDVFVALWCLHDNFHDRYSIRSFLYISVRNASLNYLKRESLTTHKMARMQEKLMSEREEVEFVVETEVERQLIAAIGSLPAECRKVLELSIEGKSYREIGEMLHIATNTVKNHRVRAVKKLRKIMEWNLTSK